ncbi:unnamed protein product [Pocillopora meandrina]|uniref:Uncharacterized protein n=1 Tax=Pocillopora meandrina TaxID=46732 RepID=A0AAU9W311_9CNID|nr:unnamed protein product [Pocillopora meandrina]
MSEKDKYKLILGSYSGTTPDSLSYHRDRPWSTQDQDNDENIRDNCAILYKGAWWYNNCHHANLNGLYFRGNHPSYADGPHDVSHSVKVVSNCCFFFIEQIIFRQTILTLSNYYIYYYGIDDTKKAKFQKDPITCASVVQNDEFKQTIHRYSGVVMNAVKILLIFSLIFSFRALIHNQSPLGTSSEWKLNDIFVLPTADDDCRNIIFKHPIPNMTMKNHAIISVEVPNEGSCKVMCYLEPNCVSINIGPVAGGNQKCELNNATEENHAPFLLVKSPGYTYLAVENPCSSSPCLNNGTCQAGFTNKGFRCVCQEKFTGETCQVEGKMAGFCRPVSRVACCFVVFFLTLFSVKRNCAEIYKSAGKPADGVYAIKPDNLPAFDVFCDQTTEGGGWTVFQKRLDGSVDFYRYWNDYKRGFGELCGEFWLGLDKIHRLTSDDKNVLRVDLEDFEGNTTYAEYNLFSVMSEKDKYRLIVGFYSGNSGDSIAFHRGMPFTTRDQDSDNHGDLNCAIKFKGAKRCHRSNLNGLYLRGNHSSHADGVNWFHWKGYNYSLKRTEMKIRPVDF